MNNEVQFSQVFQGFYRAGVVNPQTEEVDWKVEGKNLILNGGMDNLYAMSVVDQMLYGICGTGTRPNSLNSGTSKISQSVNTVYLFDTSGDITDFSASYGGGIYPHYVQIGDVLVYSNGSQSVVTNVHTDGLNLTVNPSYQIDSPGVTFTIWKTTQTGLQNEVSRSSTYLQGAGNCGSTFAGNMVTHRRSYDFPILTVDKIYNEIGVWWANGTPGTQTFSRILVDPITVPAGFYLRIVYDLNASWYPTASIYGSASIGGWSNTNGTQSVQNFLVSTINTNGTSNNSTAVLDPYYISVGSNYLSAFESQDSQSLAAFGSAIARNVPSTIRAVGTLGQSSKASYINGSYICDKTGVVGNFASNRIRSVGFGIGGGGNDPTSTTAQAFTFLFDNEQTILATQTLSLTFRFAWSRLVG